MIAHRPFVTTPHSVPTPRSCRARNTGTTRTAPCSRCCRTCSAQPTRRGEPDRPAKRSPSAPRCTAPSSPARCACESTETGPESGHHDHASTGNDSGTSRSATDPSHGPTDTADSHRPKFAPRRAADPVLTTGDSNGREPRNYRPHRVTRAARIWLIGHSHTTTLLPGEEGHRGPGCNPIEHPASSPRLRYYPGRSGSSEVPHPLGFQAVTIFATAVTRNSWPSTASITAIVWPGLVAGTRSP